MTQVWEYLTTNLELLGDDGFDLVVAIPLTKQLNEVWEFVGRGQRSRWQDGDGRSIAHDLDQQLSGLGVGEISIHSGFINEEDVPITQFGGVLLEVLASLTLPPDHGLLLLTQGVLLLEELEGGGKVRHHQRGEGLTAVRPTVHQTSLFGETLLPNLVLQVLRFGLGLLPHGGNGER